MSDNRHQLKDIKSIRTFVMGGQGTFTLVSNVTGNHFTFKTKTPKNNRGQNLPQREQKGNKPMFISAMTGPDNESSYTYLGQVWKDAAYGDGFTWQVGKKSPIAEDAPTQQAIKWLMRHVKANRMLPTGAEFWHEGRCGVCNRKLTVPDSIASGIGPICAGDR